MSDGRRYRVLGVVGRGGFGTVYRAELLGPSGFTRPVALKVLNPEVEAVRSIAERLRDEARLLGMLRHRSIVQVDGLVQLDGRWTVVMEYIEGVDLSRLIARGPTPARPALEMIGESASALHVARTWPGPDGVPLGLLHRDLKPQNLLLTAAGETKVLDFGVARADFGGREAVTQGMWFGSPGYVSPERMGGDEGPESDVFALGVVLYELLAGKVLGKISGHRARHDEAVAAALASLEVDLPVRQLLANLLDFDPEARPDARDVERRCQETVAAATGPFLRDWAERVVPELLACPITTEAPSHDFSGSLLVEHSTDAAETSFHVLEDVSGDWGTLVSAEPSGLEESGSLTSPAAASPSQPTQPASGAAPPPLAAMLPAEVAAVAELPEVVEPIAVISPLAQEVPVAGQLVGPVRRANSVGRGSGLAMLPAILAIAIFAGVGVTGLIWSLYLVFLVLASV